MKNATFYLLDNENAVDGLSAVEQLVCEIAAERWRSGKRVLIACEDEKQAIRWMKRCGPDRLTVSSRTIWQVKDRAAVRRWKLPAGKT